MKFRIKEIKLYPNMFTYYVQHKYKYCPFWFNSLCDIYGHPYFSKTYEEALENLEKYKEYNKNKRSKIVYLEENEEVKVIYTADEQSY